MAAVQWPKSIINREKEKQGEPPRRGGTLIRTPPHLQVKKMDKRHGKEKGKDKKETRKKK